LERIVYRDEEDGFTVARTVPESVSNSGKRGEEELVTVVGELPAVFPGQKLTLSGYWDYHSQYGRQFKVQEAKIDLPASEAGVEKYLASDLIKGIGPVIAERITERFGEEALSVIEEEPDRLEEVEGIGPKRLAQIKQGWKEGEEIREVMVFLQGHGISTAYAVKIYKEYGEDTVGKLEEDPYQLARDVFGIGFKTADGIAKKLGIGEEDPHRLKAGLEYALQEATGDGHLYLPRSELLDKAEELLEIGEKEEEESLPINEEVQEGERAQKGRIKKKLLSALDELLEEERAIEERELGLRLNSNRMAQNGDSIFSKNAERVEETRPVYLAPYCYAERGVANGISRLAQSKPEEEKDQLIEKANRFAQASSVPYNEGQREALKKALTSKVLIITGGPGTGKTTVLKGVVELLEDMKMEVGLAAPTGRAAKRLEEATGREAETIHRLLGFKPPNSFQYHRDNKLDLDAVILDEVSMVDALLANRLIQALPERARLVLVGDKDQLPSVGAGNVLGDLLKCGSVEKVELTEIFRQAKKSQIVTNAHRINEGQFPHLTNKANGDFFFLEEDDPERCAEKVCQLVSARLPRAYGFDPLEDIQVLAPMYRGAAGVDNLNSLLQENLNERKPLDLPFGGREFRRGDKVMQIRNDYEREVFNGDIGYVKGLNERSKELLVRFPDAGEVSYDAADLSELVLAYAVTIHKSQGSEYPAVVIPLLTQHYILLQRNLLYTALTRAEEFVVLVGQKKAIGIAVNNDKVKRRYSLLAERLAAKGEGLSSLSQS